MSAAVTGSSYEIHVRTRQLRADETARLVGIAARILGVVATSLLRAARRRRDARLLSTMDDYLLHDIGVVRSDIARAVRLGRGGLL